MSIKEIEKLFCKEYKELTSYNKEQIAIFLKEIFDKALAQFLQKQQQLFEDNVSERSWYPHFIISMYKYKDEYEFLQQYYLDAEYNRMRDGKVKVILDKNTEIINICCDVLLHGRGRCGSIENILSVEFKKKDNANEDKEKDRVRLRALTSIPLKNVYPADGRVRPEYVCGYFLGCYVEIDCENPAPENVIVEYYVCGEKVDWSFPTPKAA